MATRNSTCAQVAKLVRSVLRESFPSVKFSVRAYTYSFGDWVLIAWDDGPTERQVDPIAAAFIGLHRERNGNVHRCNYVTIDGKPLQCRLDRIIKHRGYTEAFVQGALVSVYSNNKSAFALHEIPQPTYADYVAGRLWQHKIALESERRFVSVHELVNAELDARSGSETQDSALLKRIGCADTI